MLLDADFDRAFHPSSIAIVGVSDPTVIREKKVHSGGMTGGLPTLRNLLKQGYEGRIYPINPRASEILGHKVYPTVTAIPEKVDLVIVAVPAAQVPRVLADCVKADTRNVHVMTSGFNETQVEEGIRLHEEILNIAKEGELRLIGPNCMGLQVPSAKMATLDVKTMYHGSAAFISQSGTIVTDMLDIDAESCMGFSKLISCGNSLVLDITDFIEYLAMDDETSIISMYIEGVKDGKRLLDIVQKTNPAKPVIIWKVGLGDSSARAALSHSGMIGGGRKYWEAFFKQTGAISVQSIEELSDMLATFEYMKPPRGKNAAVLAAGGGTTVAAGDVCDRYGINCPPLAASTKDELLEIISLVNQGIANPLDIPDATINPDIMIKILNVLERDPHIDFILLNWGKRGVSRPERLTKLVDNICQYVKENRNRKPLAVALRFPSGHLPKAETDPWIRQFQQVGIPVYESLERACLSLRMFIDYRQRFSKV